MSAVLTVPVVTQEDPVQDGYGLIRTESGPPIIVAVLHDGTDESQADAHRIRDLLADFLRDEPADARESV